MLLIYTDYVYMTMCSGNVGVGIDCVFELSPLMDNIWQW